MSKKKILIVCNYKWTYHTFLEKLTDNIVNNYDIDICCDLTVDKGQNKKSKVSFIDLKIPNNANILRFIQCIFSLRKIIKNNSYDLIISNNRNASFIARIVPFILHKQNKKIYIARGMYFHDAQNFLKKAISILIEYCLYFKTDLILSQSMEDVKFFSKLPFIKKSKIVHIGNGINHEIFNSKIKIFNNKIIKFCTTGRYSKLKNYYYLLKSFKQYLKFNKNSHLTFIGGDIEGSKAHFELIDQVKNLNLTKYVTLTGVVDTAKDYLDVCDVYIHPSLREGMPRSLLEAMSMKKIVLASNIRGCREIIHNNKSGFLFNPYKNKDLVSLMIKVSKLSKNQIDEISINARKTVENHYREDKYIERQVKYINYSLQ